MRSAWESNLGANFRLSSTQRFVLDKYAPKRRQVLLPGYPGWHEHCVTVLLLLHVPANGLDEIYENDQFVPPRTKQEIWSESWEELGPQALQTIAGSISSSWVEGWSMEEEESAGGRLEDWPIDPDLVEGTRLFLGAFRFGDLDAARALFDDLATAEGASGEVLEVRYVRMHAEQEKVQHAVMYGMLGPGYNHVARRSLWQPLSEGSRSNRRKAQTPESVSS